MDRYNVKKFLFDVIKNDFGYGYIPKYHKDIIDMENFYINPKNNIFLLALNTKNGEIVGTAGIRAYDRDFKLLNGKYDLKSTASFCRVFVNKKWRRKGVASALIHSAEEFCGKKGYSKVYLHTQKTVKGSLDFWLSNGYKIVSDTENKLGTVHMEKNIKKHLVEPERCDSLTFELEQVKNRISSNS